MNKIIKDALILFAITLVAGVLLGAVYEVTKEPIAQQNEKAKQAAYQEVMADAEKFEALSGDEYSEANITATFADLLANDAESYTKDEINEVVAGIKGGKVIGLVITVTAGDGYGGDIQYSVGVSSTGEYLGTSILSISETAGLGMRAKSDPTFLAQFVGANTDKFTLTKNGVLAADADAQIDAISGSTVTSKAIMRGVNAALLAYKSVYASHVQTVGGVTVE
jgi:electron transport complex protein RnfG